MSQLDFKLHCINPQHVHKYYSLVQINQLTYMASIGLEFFIPYLGFKFNDALFILFIFLFFVLFCHVAIMWSGAEIDTFYSPFCTLLPKTPKSCQCWKDENHFFCVRALRGMLRGICGPLGNGFGSSWFMFTLICHCINEINPKFSVTNSGRPIWVF